MLSRIYFVVVAQSHIDSLVSIEAECAVELSVNPVFSTVLRFTMTKGSEVVHVDVPFVCDPTGTTPLPGVEFSAESPIGVWAATAQLKRADGSPLSGPSESVEFEVE
jgi:hypothetical protein